MFVVDDSDDLPDLDLLEIPKPNSPSKPPTMTMRYTPSLF